MSASDGHAIVLPGGLWRDGALHRRAAVRPLSGADEVALVEHSTRPAARASALLARCVTRLGDEEATEDAVRALAAGDREALLLHIRRLTFGERLAAVLDCPAADCGERMDLELDVGDLLVTPGAERAEWHSAPMAGADGVARVTRFRLPTGEDQEAVAELDAATIERPDAAATAVIARCVDRDEAERAGEQTALSVEAAAQLSERMAQLDPQAEIWLAATCPQCGAAFSALLDAGAYLFEELTATAAALYQEVHRLAFHYHWSEREILSMTPRQRRRYLDLLDDELSAP